MTLEAIVYVAIGALAAVAAVLAAADGVDRLRGRDPRVVLSTAGVIVGAALAYGLINLGLTLP